MGLPPSSVSLNAACPSEPLLCLLDRTGPRGDGAQGPCGSKAERYFVCTNTELSRQANAEIPRGIRTSLWMKKLQHVQHLRTG